MGDSVLAKFRRILQAVVVLSAVYLLTIFIFVSKTFWAIYSSAQIYEQLDKSGYSKEWKAEYLELLPILDDVIMDSSSILLAPVRSYFLNNSEFKSLIEAYEIVGPALPTLPELLGLDRSRNYLIAFQNSAEARGTGGIIGAYAVAELNGGLKIREVGTNSLLQSLDEVPIKLPDEFSSLYRSDPAIWQNSNMSPHFPYGAKIWLALWEKQFQEDLDGVITLDPIVLKSILEITGPISVQGKQINSENVVEETLSELYLEFETNNVGRKQYLVEIIEKTFLAIKNYEFAWSKQIVKLTKPLIENRVLAYSASKDIQKILRQAQFSGVMKKNDNNEYRLIVQNTAGNKMDYYLEREFFISSRSCKNEKISEVSLTLTNTASSDSYLPAYVKGRLDLDLPEGKQNSTAITALIYGPSNSKLISAIDPVTGKSIGYQKMERERPVLVIPLELNAGEKRTFIADFKGGIGGITTQEQPLVKPQYTKIEDKCK